VLYTVTSLASLTSATALSLCPTWVWRSLDTRKPASKCLLV